jgi:hypothetical protein
MIYIKNNPKLFKDKLTTINKKFLSLLYGLSVEIEQNLDVFKTNTYNVHDKVLTFINNLINDVLELFKMVKDIEHKNKYLKYKNKYLKLKQHIKI